MASPTYERLVKAAERLLPLCENWAAGADVTIRQEVRYKAWVRDYRAAMDELARALKDV